MPFETTLSLFLDSKLICLLSHNFSTSRTDREDQNPIPQSIQLDKNAGEAKPTW